jgi:hypothetical protein
MPATPSETTPERSAEQFDIGMEWRFSFRHNGLQRA